MNEQDIIAMCKANPTPRNLATLKSLQGTKVKASKYRNKKIKAIVKVWCLSEPLEMTFDSLKEYNRYLELQFMERSGIIKHLEPQRAFVLMNEGKGMKVKWIADAIYFHNEYKKWVAEDTKSPFSRKKASYIIKRKMFKSKYPEWIFHENI